MIPPAVDYAYRFASADRLYLNVTNRCTNRCAFCVRNFQPGLGDGRLWGGPEPDVDDLMHAVEARGGAEAFSEIVWCGFGEPTFRLDLIVEASSAFRAAGARVRLDTNGHGELIHGRDVIPELEASIDDVYVSLNAPTCQRYLELCRPGGGDYPRQVEPERYWLTMLDFLRRAAAGRFGRVQASVVGHVLDGDEIDACRELAASLGCDELRVR
jgi:TatD DNase family protein